MTNLLSTTLCRSEKFMMDLYLSHLRPKIEYGSSLWNSGYLGDVRKVERLQRRWTRSVADLEDLPYGERLRKLGIFSLQGRLLRNDLILTWKIVHGESSIKFDNLFLLSSGSTRGHQFKIKPSRCNLDILKRSFAERIVKPWNALHSNTVSATCLSTFKRLLHLDMGEKLYEYV